MKTKLLAFFLFVLFANVSHSQTFSLISIDTIQIDAAGSVPSCHANIQNNDTAGLYIDIIRLVNDTAPNWQTAFCVDVCYPPNRDSARLFLPGNFTQGFLLEFFSDTLPDTTIVFMKFKNVADPSNSFYQHYYGITDLTFGVNEANKNSTRVKIFPSPVSSGKPFTFQITDASLRTSDYCLSVYDIYGNKVGRFDGLANSANSISLDLPAGLYVYSLSHENKLLKTGKIAVSR